MVCHAVGGGQTREGIVAIANMPAAQLGSSAEAKKPLGRDPDLHGYAFRGFNTTQQRFCSPDAPGDGPGEIDEDDYTVTDGERICSMAIGWNSATATTTSS